LANIWARVLGLDRVGVYDDFFELGGHSLLATPVMSAIKQTFDITLSVQTLFERHTIDVLAEIVEEALLCAAHPQ
jgi:acyl carrier protein